MGHTVELPEALYRKVVEYATQRHQAPDTVIVSWVADAVCRAESQLTLPGDLAPDEPMSLLAGIISVPDTDAGDYHDLYFSHATT